MKMKVEYFTAVLVKSLKPSDVYLTVNENAKADLLNILSEEDSFLLLAIRGESQYEVVKIKNISGTLVMQRGIAGTTPVNHHVGSCVVGVTPLMAEAMKEFFCNYNCCEE